MPSLTVALLQLARPGHDLRANLVTGEAACRRAKALGADIALFPEMWSNGYTAAAAPPGLSPGPDEDGDAADVLRHPRRWGPDGDAPHDSAPGPRHDSAPAPPRDSAPGPRHDSAPAPPRDSTPADGWPPPHAAWQGEAIATDSPFVRQFQDLAAELDLAIALTYLEEWRPAPRNTVSLIDRHGCIALTQAKVHPCAFALPEAALTPGDRFEVCALDTAAGEVRVGAMICYDREFPESARALMLAGAEIVLTPNACELEINRLAQFRARAFENMTGMAMANYAGPGLGRSVAFDGIAFAEGRSRDMLLVEAGEAPGVHLAVFDLGALRDHRRRETWGNAFRRPVAYAPLTAVGVDDPFVRVTRDGRRPPR
ncbi:nitrilase-related carbon-nitrogen hydrolase [Streptomyces sp. NPDC047108]|uniref:carbon-nitrogen hydrolase family protein n=1 Tax=Streptomyces sp. NPDC047108 TaxID=3155025 RepID=UPI0034103A60